jgi:hypothetical protein
MAKADDLIVRARALVTAQGQWPIVNYAGSIVMCDESTWERRIPRDLPGYLAEIDLRLSELEAQDRRQREIERQAAENPGGVGANAEILLAGDAAERAADASAQAVYRASTPGRLERIEQLLERLVELQEAEQ